MSQLLAQVGVVRARRLVLAWHRPHLRFSLDPSSSDFPQDADLPGNMLRESWRFQRWEAFLVTGCKETGPLQIPFCLTDAKGGAKTES